MKQKVKHLFILLLLMCCNINLYALSINLDNNNIDTLIQASPIQKNFFGLTLGASKKSQVLNTMKELGYPLHVNKDKDTYSYVGEITFGGESWDSVSFGIENDLLNTIMLTNSSSDISILKEHYKTLYVLLCKKYEKWKYKEKTSPEIKSIIFNDNDTLLLFQLDFRTGEELLLYTTLSSFKQYMESIEDEL